MTVSALVAAGSFASVCAVALWLLIGGRGAWLQKLPLVVLLPLLAFALYGAYKDSQGWPADRRPPDDATLVWGEVHEPTSIYLWLQSGDGRPRAYRVPYTRQLHRQVDEATAARQRGERVGVRRARGGGGQSAGSRSRYVFHRLPPPMPPGK